MSARVDSDRTEVCAAVETLLEVAEAHGAELHPTLRVIEHDDQLSVHADATDGEALVSIPETAFVQIDRFDWSASGNILVVDNAVAGTSTAQRELAQALATVYNVTDKLRWTREMHPDLALRDSPAAVDAINSLRPNYISTKPSLVDVFLHTRKYVHEGVHSLLPIVELLNHHRHGAPLRLAHGRMTIPIARVAGTTECFVTYGQRRDAIDLVCTYGYFDPDIRFARSLPVTVDVPGVGVVEVDGRRIVASSLLDPPTVSIASGRLQLSHLTFHAEHPERLVAVLQLAVHGLLRRSGATVTDPEAATRLAILGLADENLRRLGAAELVLRQCSGVPAETVASALQSQRAVIDGAVRDLGATPASPLLPTQQS